MRAALCAIAALFALRSATGHAQGHPYTCLGRDPVGLTVSYANGMFTSEQAAAASLAVIRSVFANDLQTNLDSIAFEQAYNQNEELRVQLWEVVRQRLGGYASDFVRFIEGTLPVPRWLFEEYLELSAADELERLATDDDLELHLRSYRDHLSKGHKVLVVAHSQGNLYANAAHRRLFELDGLPGRESFRVVGIATPASEIAGDQSGACPWRGCYTTLSEDFVINWVRRNLPDTLPPNEYLHWSDTSDTLAHLLVATYLNDPAPRAHCVHNIEAQIAELVVPAASVLDGVMTAELTWDSEADLDLHVYEDDGRHHVSYLEPEGPVGSLYQDDTDGFGPEDYFAECGRLQPGSYEFRVGYYEGDGPTTATLHLVVAGVTRSFSRELQAPTRPGEHPLLATVEVTHYGDDRYEFLITGAPDR